MTNSFDLAKKYHLSNSVEYADGSIVSKIITKNDGGNITLFAFDSGQVLSKHSAPFDAFVQVLDGEGTILIDDKATNLKQGEGIIMPANIPHAVEAPQRFKMMLVMIKA